MHSNPDNEMTVLAIMENAKFVCSSLRRLEEQILLPKLPIGTPKLAQGNVIFILAQSLDPEVRMIH